MRTRTALLATLVTTLAFALPSAAGAAVYQYGCCATSNGVTLKTTNGWLYRTSNNKSNPPSRDYRLAGYLYDGSFGGSLYYSVIASSSPYSYPVGGASTRQDCTNVSGYYLINVSCWTIE